jgi:hypothetical protein
VDRGRSVKETSSAAQAKKKKKKGREERRGRDKGSNR